MRSPENRCIQKFAWQRPLWILQILSKILLLSMKEKVVPTLHEVPGAEMDVDACMKAGNELVESPLLHAEVCEKR